MELYKMSFYELHKHLEFIKNLEYSISNKRQLEQILFFMQKLKKEGDMIIELTKINNAPFEQSFSENYEKLVELIKCTESKLISWKKKN